MSEDAETSASTTKTTGEEVDSHQLPNPTENPPTASASVAENGSHAVEAGAVAAGPMLNPYLPPGVVPYYRQVATGSVALPSNSTTTAVGTTPPTTAYHPHHHGLPAYPTMHMFPPHYNPYSFMQNQHTYQQQYHAAAMAFNPHAPPYGPAGGIQVGMISPYGLGYPYGMVDPLRRQSFPPVPTTTIPPATTSTPVEKKKRSDTEDSSSSQPKTIPGLASLTSPSYYPSPPDINEARRTGVGRKIVPVTRDVPEDLAEQRPDELYEEVDVLDSSAPVSEATPGDQANIADPGSYPWATSVSGPSTFHGVPLTTKFRCKICDHIFPKKHTVVTHIKTHLGKKSYPCTYEGCTMAFVREHDRKRHQTTHTGEKAHTCECGKQFSRQDALRRHAQYGRCPNRGPVPSQLANVKGVLSSIAGEDGDLQDDDEEAIAKALEEDVSMDAAHDGEAFMPNKVDGDQVAGEDDTAASSNPTGRTRGRRPAAPKKEKEKEKAETSAPKPRASRKKRKRAAFARPVDDGDSELDEDSDGAAASPPPPPPTTTNKRKPKKQRKSPQTKAPHPVAATNSPEEEDELIDSYEEEDPNHAPSSFQFALPGVQSKEQAKASQPKARVQPRRGRGGAADSLAEASVDGTAVAGTQTGPDYDPASLPPQSYGSTAAESNSGDKYASIVARMNRTPFNIETEVMKTSFPLGLVRNVGGQGAASEALQKQQADQDVTMSDWVQDQDSDADADTSEGNAGVGNDGTKLAPVASQTEIDVDSEDPEEEDVAAVLGVARSSKETSSAVAAS